MIQYVYNCFEWDQYNNRISIFCNFYCGKAIEKCSIPAPTKKCETKKQNRIALRDPFPMGIAARDSFYHFKVSQQYKLKHKCLIIEEYYNFKKHMKAFAFRNQKNKLKICNIKSQFNKQNDKTDVQDHNFAVVPLPKVASSEEHAFPFPLPGQPSRKVTFFKMKPSQQKPANLPHPETPPSKIEKRSLSQNEPMKSKKDLSRVFSVKKLDKSESTRSINPPTSKSLKEIDEKYPSLKQGIEQLFALLKRQYIIQQNHIKFYTVKKQSLEEIMLYAFSYFLANDRDKMEMVHMRYSQFHFLKNTIAKMGRNFEEEFRKEKQTRLGLLESPIIFGYTHTMYHNQIGHHQKELQNLLEDQEEIKKKVKFHQDKNSFYKKEIEENIIEVRNQIQEKNRLEDIVRILEQDKERLKGEIEKHNELLKETNEAEEKITNFVNQQNNRMLKIVSEDYKSIESDIYEYAVYLQSNQLASDLNYEPAPFKVIEESIMEDMRNINKSIIQNDSIEIEIKHKMMRDFIVLSMERYKRKDSEMLKLADFKTKCIRKFVSNMQKWLDNWTLKQEYLVNLRKEFLLDTNSIGLKIEEMRRLSLCGECRQKKDNLFESMVDLYKKIELNYKMGNSFY